ncbi:tRNA1(Val) (adenine(37)-N6)-methyltransferase [Tropicimonas sp. IMCC34011]|uniref:tRNA1(Val) (adenine(37)-N6)-methyltransferase n=1 Tax=Tropicimonas sp. IMCC34011 TaxID=2248759 RepID=UPI000E262416|nr:methyltransferase [Tropicimonas sp. IMCC34011]
MAEPAEPLTRDAFLGGRLTLLQPAKGFRAGIDAVLLASACPAKSGQSVLDLGCGVGTAALCLATRVPGLHLTGLERDAAIADLARRNSDAAGIAMEVLTGDIAAPPPALKAMSFDHVIANPPYFDAARATAATDAYRDSAMREDVPLAAWTHLAAKRLRPGGWLTFIQRADRLGDLLGAAEHAGFGSLRIQPIAGRAGHLARLVLLNGRKGGRGALELAAPFILHEGPAHISDGDDFTSAASAILRDGAQFIAPGS